MIAQTRLLERAGGDLNRITRDLKVPFDALQSMLQCCSPQLCTALGRGENCTLADLPTVMSPLPDGDGLAVMGSLPIASTTAEILLLEYVDNLPMGEVAWGRATLPQLRDTWRLHTEHFDLTQRTPYLARKMGSALMFEVAAAVTSARSLGFGVVDPAVRDAKFVAYVGHDTNIWNLAGMLDVSWLQNGWQRNQTPPAGALLFEVRELPDKKLQGLHELRRAIARADARRHAAGRRRRAAAHCPAPAGLQQHAAGISMHDRGIRGRGAQLARSRLRERVSEADDEARRSVQWIADAANRLEAT